MTGSDYNTTKYTTQEMWPAKFPLVSHGGDTIDLAKISWATAPATTAVGETLQRADHYHAAQWVNSAEKKPAHRSNVSCLNFISLSIYHDSMIL